MHRKTQLNLCTKNARTSWVWAFFCLLFAQFLDASEAIYRVTFSPFGEMGFAHTKIHKTTHTYTISVEANTTGIARTFSGNRIERYESIGRIHEGRLIPDTFIQNKRSKNISERTLYYFDHAQQKITKVKEKNETGEPPHRDEEVLPFYAKDDVLSLFFNMQHAWEGYPKGSTVHLIAAGANKTDGRVEVELPEGEKLERLKQSLGDGGRRYMSVRLNQPIFLSPKGELNIRMTEDGLSDRAILRSVIFFGDVKGERITP